MTGLEKPLLRVKGENEKRRKKKRENAGIAKEKMSNPLYGQGNN